MSYAQDVNTPWKKARSWISLCKYDENAGLMNNLEEEDSSHGSKAESTVDSAEAGSGVLLVTTSTLGGGLVPGGSGVNDLSEAGKTTLDQLLVAEVLVEVAGIGDVLAGLEVEGTLDAIKLRRLDPVVY